MSSGLAFLSVFLYSFLLNACGLASNTTTIDSDFSYFSGNEELPVIERQKVGYYQKINFYSTFLLNGNSNSEFKTDGPTSIVLGPDNRYYIGTYDGSIITATIYGNRVYNTCESKRNRKRQILGLAFNPADGDVLKLYATECTLYWNQRWKMPFSTGWLNGAVVLFEPDWNRPGCMTKTRYVITGLPVSNKDKGINKLAFDDYGSLYVTIGGATNGGIAHPSLGNWPESALSGSVLFAPILIKGFNGNIKHSSTDPRAAEVVSGTVSLYAVGLRNSFGLIYHTSGRLYGTDNGLNNNYGPRSTGCKTQEKERPSGDKFLLIKKGAWYGGSNRVRGKKDSKQCVHMRPGIDKLGHELPLAILPAVTTGIVEYTANTFGALMRGDILLTQYIQGNERRNYIYRAVLDPFTGKLAHKLLTLARGSGLSAAMSTTGDIIMPRIRKDNFALLLAMEENPGIVAVTTVNPLRGPKRGGNTLTVTGWNFGTLIKAIFITVGGKPCLFVRQLSKEGRSVQCTAPPGVGRVPVIVTVAGNSSKTAGFEYWYMKI